MTKTVLNKENYLIPKYFHGKTIGRTGNRIAGSTIQIDGKSFNLENNEGPNTLHGGINGLSTKEFSYKIQTNEKNTKVIFSRVSEDGESGFPGKLTVAITYLLKESSSSFKCSFRARTTKATLCNLTNHSYFTMGEKSLDNVALKVNSSHYLLTNPEDLLPIKKENVNKVLDFRKFKTITADIQDSSLHNGKLHGYDHHLYFDEINTRKAQVILKSKTDLLKIYTNFEGCQFYSDNKDSQIDWVDITRNKHSSIAVEPQDDYLARKILYPNDSYSRFIRYEFRRIK